MIIPQGVKEVVQQEANIKTDDADYGSKEKYPRYSCTYMMTHKKWNSKLEFAKDDCTD